MNYLIVDMLEYTPSLKILKEGRERRRNPDLSRIHAIHRWSQEGINIATQS